MEYPDLLKKSYSEEERAAPSQLSERCLKVARMKTQYQVNVTDHDAEPPVIHGCGIYKRQFRLPSSVLHVQSVVGDATRRVLRPDGAEALRRDPDLGLMTSRGRWPLRHRKRKRRPSAAVFPATLTCAPSYQRPPHYNIAMDVIRLKKTGLLEEE